MVNETPVTASSGPSTPERCPFCNGQGPTARTDWRRFQEGERCPDCGASSSPEQAARLTRIEAVLGGLYLVLVHLEADECEGALRNLETRAAHLDPRNRPELTLESKACPQCGAESRGHRFARRLLVCPSCSTIWSRNRRGQPVIEPVL